MGVVGWLDRAQRRHRWFSLPLGVVYKFLDDQATSMAAMITYYGFASLFPLLLLLVTCLGFALNGNPELQQAVLSSAVRDFPVIGEQLTQNVHSLHGSTAGLVVGIGGSLYGGLGIALAMQNAMNKIWAVPRAERPSLLGAYGRALALLGLLVLGVLATTAMSAMATLRLPDGGVIGSLAWRVAGVLLSVAVTSALLALAYRLLTSVRIPTWDELWPGALTATVLWQLLQGVGVFLVGHRLRGASATYGLFGIVLGLLGWIYLGALILLIGAEINTVRARRLFPRSLLAPDPSDSAITPADRRAYASYAETERQKNYQTIHTDFKTP